MKQHLYKTTS